MNCASARWSRAMLPRRTTKRAPDSFAAVAKSSPAIAAGMSKCSRGAKSSVRGVPQRRSSTLAVSSGPSGTSGSGRFGMVRRRSRSRVVLGLGFGGQAGDFGLCLGHEGAQAVEFRVVATGLGGADLFRGRVLGGLGGLGREDLRAAGRVDGQHLGRSGGQAAPGKGGVEGGGVVADQADVVHGAARGVV
jgi:hypothetical protein